MQPEFKNSLDVDASRWFIPFRQSGGVCRLVCIPYAGGSAHVYNKWKTLLKDKVDVHAVQLPGRGNRFRDPVATEIEQVISPLASAMKTLFDKPFILFGHSMGGLLAFELARRCQLLFGIVPLCLFVSGCRAPKRVGLDQSYAQLDDERFLNAVNRYGAIPDEVFLNADLRSIVLPALRADYAILESYRYHKEAPLDCPIVSFGGQQDSEVSADDLQAWEEETTRPFQRHLLTGGHFFIRESEADLLAIVNRYLLEI